MTESPPLEGYRVVGLRENRYKPHPDAPSRPGGSCWHCGTGIAIEVVISNGTEQHVIGTTCAERVGLNGPELKAFLAEKYADERAARSKAGREAAARAWAERDAAETLEHGEHGTETRFRAGCRCDPCIAGAPHGTWPKFADGACTCSACLDYALLERPADDTTYKVGTFDVLVDLATGDVVDGARIVDTRYGARWAPTARTDWAPVRPARRTTLSKRGVTEAEATFLYVDVKGRSWRDGFRKPLARLSSPIIDRWNEPIPRGGTDG